MFEKSEARNINMKGNIRRKKNKKFRVFLSALGSNDNCEYVPVKQAMFL